MRSALRLALFSLICACGGETPQESELEPTPVQSSPDTPLRGDSELIPPPRRRPILGVFGFTARSSIRFDAMPEAPHQLSATYAFPDRARWYIEPANAQRGQRSVRYRSGPQAWELAPGAGQAERYEGDQATQALLQLELRRAALLWPHGLDWSLREEVDGAVHSAPLKSGGSLIARSSSKGALPSTFSSELPNGSLFEELREIEWTDGPFGSRPSSWRLVSGGAPVWLERIESLDTKVRFVDSHFLPPHLRALPSAGGASPVQLVEVPARLRQRRALQAKTWEGALQEAKELLNATTPPSPAERVDPSPVFELNHDGRPVAVLIRLISRTEETPEGWERAPGESALSRLSPEGALPDAASLQALLNARPSDAESGRARLRVTFDGDAVESTQLLLPLSPSDLED